MKRTRINPISLKQRKELKLRSKLKKELIEEHGAYCQTCGGTGDFRGISLSHIIPLSRGGKTSKENCILEDYSCHSKRHGIKET